MYFTFKHTYPMVEQPPLPPLPPPSDDLFPVTHPFPPISSELSRESLNTLLNDYATRNKFVMVVTKSDARRLIFQCERGGQYRHKKVEPKKRQRRSTSHKMGCPYRVRFSKLKQADGFKLNKPVGPHEYCHNHPLDDDNLLSTSRGRRNHLMLKEEEEDMPLEEPAWRKCVDRVEALFCAYEGDQAKTDALVAAIETILDSS